MITINGIDIQDEIINGNPYYSFRSILICATNFNSSFNISRELRNINKENYLRPTKKGRGCKTYLTPMGVVDFISKTYRLDSTEKKYIIQQLKTKNYIDKNLILSYTRKELDFLSALKEYFSIYDISIKSQYSLNDECIIDYVIKDLAIEYDEGDHSTYSKILEEKRELEIKKAGYKLIRLSDKNSSYKNLAIVAKAVFK